MKKLEAISEERSNELYNELLYVLEDYFVRKDASLDSITMDNITIAIVEKKIPKTITEAVVVGAMMLHLVKEIKSIAEDKKDHYEMQKSN